MSPNLRAPSMLKTIVGVAALVLTTGEAFAQASSDCGAIQGQLEQRKAIAASLQAGGNKKIDAKTACAGFGRLVTNGTGIIKWLDANKDWCQVPDSFVSGIKADHVKAQEIRGKACNVATKIQQMEKQAKSGNGGNGGSGLLGGGGLTGPTSLPQGAL